MSKPVRGGVAAAFIAGLAVLTVVVAAVGYRSVLAAIGAAGFTGFGVFTVYWPLVVGVLALAWFAVSPGLGVGRLWVLVWARFLRDAGSDILPFAQVSGFLIGARAAQAEGVPEDLVVASTIADVTAELAAQFLYTLLGVGLLALQLRGNPVGAALFWPTLGALAFLLVAAIAFVLLQRRSVGLLAGLARRWLPNSAARAEAVRATLDAIYRQPGRLVAGVALHMLGWIGSGAGSWIALQFMGADAPLWAVLAVESLMYAARSVVFVLPGGLGVQEGAYVLLAPLFGLQPNDVLALSLLRRGRDLVLGVPALLIWQAREGRALLAAGPGPAPSRDL